MIIIAHRLSTIKDASSIIVIDSGEIKEVGTHHQLIKNDDVIRKLRGLKGTSVNIKIYRRGHKNLFDFTIWYFIHIPYVVFLEFNSTILFLVKNFI